MKSLRAYAALSIKLPLDLALIAAAILSAYYLAAEFDFPRPLSKGTPEVSVYINVLPILWIAYVWAAHSFNLYRPRRAGSYGSLLIDLAKVHVQMGLIAFFVGFYFRQHSYSRVIISTFFVINPIVIFLHHLIWLARERRLFMEGVGTRRCLIVGRGSMARSIAKRIRKHPWTGLEIRGFLDAGEQSDGVTQKNDVLGDLDDLERVLEEHGVQEVIVALPFRDLGVLPEIDQRLSRTNVGVRSVLDLEAFNTFSREIADFDGLQVINLRGVRADGANAVIKRALDITLSATLLVLLSPVLLGIALTIWLTSGRPIIYVQDRVGLDGMTFPMLKFRTMVHDAENKTGPVWADDSDNRCTPLGAFLRRTSMDELPQLWNALKGQMSLVGPRPERPVFIEEFRKTIPRYMLRHRMKAGLTGWAQVNGWRGKTSLSKRVEFDLYYLRNWSVWLDLKILFLTLLRAWRRPKENPYGESGAITGP